MKKILLLPIILSVIFIFGNSNNVSAKGKELNNATLNNSISFSLDSYGNNITHIIGSDGISRNITGLGRGIDTVSGSTDKNSKVKTSADIFDADFLNEKLKNAVPNIANYSYSTYYSGNTIEEIGLDLKAKLNYSSDISYGVNMFSNEQKRNYELNCNINTNKYLSYYYFHSYNYRHTYDYALPNTSYLTEYKANLDSDFIEFLREYYSETKTKEELFNTFGTHVVSRGYYGGACDVYYSCASNGFDLSLAVGGSVENTIKSALTDGDNRNLSSGNGFKLDINGILNTSTQNTEEKFYCSVVGGEGFSATNSMNGLSNTINTWYNTVDEKTSMYSMDLIPIWKLLPPELDTEYNVSKLKYDFYNYDASQKGSTVIYSPNISLNLICDLTVSTEELIVTDDTNKNYGHILDINKTSYSPNILSQLGYDLMGIQVNFTMREIKDGYQYIEVYDSDVFTSAHRLYSGTYEHGGTGKEDNAIEYYFLIQNVDISQLEKGKLYCKYSADGIGNDDWGINYVTVKLFYSKC